MYSIANECLTEYYIKIYSLGYNRAAQRGVQAPYLWTQYAYTASAPFSPIHTVRVGVDGFKSANLAGFTPYKVAIL